MADKKSEKDRGERKSAEGPPSNSEDFLKLDNEPAVMKLPKKLATRAKSVRVSIYVPDKDFDLRKSAKARRPTGALEIVLPSGSAAVRPGQDSGRMSSSDVARGIKDTISAEERSGPLRPPWVDYAPHAKQATERTPLLRRIDGKKLEAHYGVFGPDDRQVYHPSGYPWTCIGKILVWDDFSRPAPAWSGSGVLIGGRVVLTAGHMAPWGSNNWAMQFIPAFYDGGSTLGTGVSSWVSDYWGYDTGNSVSAWDMVVLRLYTPLGNTYGYFGTKDYSSAWEGGNYWTLAGYPGAVAGGNRPSRQMWWPVLDDDSDGAAEEVEYEADATAGDSGGPVFGFWSGLPYAIATHSGGSKTTFLWWTLEDTNVGAGGGALNSLVAWARSNWP
jgi:V8-like Glu-specific endopeptidase